MDKSNIMEKIHLKKSYDFNSDLEKKGFEKSMMDPFMYFSYLYLL